MASTFSTSLKLELMATGENAGTWGTKTNTNLSLVEQAIGGYQEIDVASSDVTLTMSNASISNARNMVLKLTGTLAGTRVVTLPDDIEKVFIVVDGTTHSGNTLTFKTATGTGVTLTEGKTDIVFSDGTNIVGVTGANLSGVTLDQVLENGDTSDGTINVSTINVSGTMTADQVDDSKGEIRSVPINTKSSDYTLQASDHGKIISISAGDITVPSGVFTAGQTVTIYADGATIDINRSGVTMYWAQTGADADRDLQSRGVATIVCVASNTFVITGGLLS
tara:strand:+ start:8930 stop:9766 length:837 start_codon:yes stop_codon:yes gene_type:complete